MAIEQLLAEIERRGLLIDLDAAAAEHCLTREMVLARSRVQSIVAGRRTFCRALRARGLSYPEIGRLIDRDHTTVMALLQDVRKARVPRTVEACSRPRCVRCGAIYDDHRSQPPHTLPARSCAGFMLAVVAAEAG